MEVALDNLSGAGPRHGAAHRPSRHGGWLVDLTKAEAGWKVPRAEGVRASWSSRRPASDAADPTHRCPVPEQCPAGWRREIAYGERALGRIAQTLDGPDILGLASTDHWTNQWTAHLGTADMEKEIHMRVERRSRRVVAGVAVSCAVVLMSACSTAQGGGAGADKAAGISNQTIKELSQSLDDYSKDPSFKAPGPAFDARKAMKGKYIFSVPFSLAIEFNSDIINSMSAAAKDVGFRFRAWSSDGSPTSWVQGMNTGASQHPDLIDTVTNQPATFLPQVKSAVNAGIKVVDSHSFGTEQPTPESLNKLGVKYVNGPYELGGELMSKWVIAHSKGNAKVLVLTAYDSSSSPALQTGIKRTFAKYCPKTCSFDIQSIPVNSWSTRVQPTVQSAVTRDHNLDWIILTYDAMAGPAAAALQATQSTDRVKIATFNGSPAAIDMVRQGKIDMVVGEDVDWIGKAIIDSEMRLLAGRPMPKNPQIPVKIFSKDNAESAGVPAKPNMGYGNAYMDGYAKLWGLK